MSDIPRKIRIDIVRNNKIISTVGTEIYMGCNNIDISSHLSINSFPRLSLSSSVPEVNQTLMDFSKQDIMRVLTSYNNDDVYSLMFEGEFYQQHISFDSDPIKSVVNIDIVHSFYRLCLMELTSLLEFKGLSFEEFILMIVRTIGIDSEININEELKGLPIKGISKNTNLFRLFKEVCLIIGASVVFNGDNTVTIESRTEKLQRSMSRAPIPIQDIISFESKLT